eukprot:TRINITY_DN13676_c0_g1_i1.p3 TRINITY_DN13676_c0_g1~~TRINITY_DN13676_c0_g1_i1.p3  ORF type:complete len:107 (-),score=0.34 TRINITY_DN13676_c0_g1_i1:6-326(-)
MSVTGLEGRCMGRTINAARHARCNDISCTDKFMADFTGKATSVCRCIPRPDNPDGCFGEQINPTYPALTSSWLILRAKPHPFADAFRAPTIPTDVLASRSIRHILH